MDKKTVIQSLARKVGYELTATSKSTYFPTVLERGLALAGPIVTVIDVGATDGRWSADIRDRLPNAHLLMWEASPEWHDALRAYAASQGPAAHAVLAAASDHEGEIHFHLDSENPFGGGASTVETVDHAAVVPCRPIDDVVAENGLTGPFLLKLDTQGHEVEVLAGAMNTLADTSLAIVEAYGVDEPGRMAFDELCAHMRTLGFRPAGMADVLTRPSDGMLWQLDLIFVRREHPAFTNKKFQ